jgi:hypothetical protein
MSLQFDAIGPSARINIDGDLGQFTVNRNVILGKTGQIYVSNDLTTSFSVSGDVALNGGRISVGRDLIGTFVIGGSLTASNSSQFLVGRNFGAMTSEAAPISISGNLTASVGSALVVGGNLSALSVGGNIEMSTGGQIVVSGNLGNVMVTGSIQGSGGDDLTIGGNLGQLTVLGQGPSGFSLQSIGIEVTKSVQGIDIRNGIAYTVIAAGILINGGTPGIGSNEWNIGPNDTIASLNSQLTASMPIQNIVYGGKVIPGVLGS